MFAKARGGEEAVDRARAGGVGLGLWGAVGMLVLVVGFGVPPGAIPGEVLIIAPARPQ